MNNIYSESNLKNKNEFDKIKSMIEVYYNIYKEILRKFKNHCKLNRIVKAKPLKNRIRLLI
jgi:hypothetical protein